MSSGRLDHRGGTRTERVEYRNPVLDPFVVALLLLTTRHGDRVRTRYASRTTHSAAQRFRTRRYPGRAFRASVIRQMAVRTDGSRGATDGVDVADHDPLAQRRRMNGNLLDDPDTEILDRVEEAREMNHRTGGNVVGHQHIVGALR